MLAYDVNLLLSKHVKVCLSLNRRINEEFSMDLSHSLAIYISLALFCSFLLLWFIAICWCRGPCVDYNRPVKSAFEAHLDPAIRNFAIKKKYDLYYERLLKGVHPPDPSPREQAMMDDSSASYFIRTPLAGLTADDIPLKGKQKNQESSNAESIDSTNGSLTEMDRGTQALLKTRPIPTIMITKGSSSEIGKGSTDMSTSSQRSLEV
ncbi:uncharacterized protein LOC5515665 [Nematostella vectensis]|uniref:uncharacterized protein LOC5515665 n=1 Tax=Nematostella vectensis TaxID=45351 RepID=UPI0020772F5D|nr:uncharacterized protein LOC5515665 [Nematostella vectensis]